MSKEARTTHRAVRAIGVGIAAFSLLAVAGCSGSSSGDDAGGDVTLEFAQWWEPELPDGALRGMMDQFEEENPGIKVELLSGPYASTKEQLFAGAAAGTMSDVVGLDGAWVNDFSKQGAIADLTELMADNDYDDSVLASQIKIDGSTYMIPVVNFVYPLFTNDDILADAGVAAPPTNRTEFEAAAKAITDKTDAAGWGLPLSLETPSVIQNNVMSWVWSSGGSMLDDGKPDVDNAEVASIVEYVKGMYDDGLIAPGAFTAKEQDMVEEFTNGRIAMMVDSLAHINQIRETNPDLNFSISSVPAKDDFTGDRGIPYASWGIGVSDASEHKTEAWKLVDFLMSEEVNAELSTVANAFPGNKNSTPDFAGKDELFAKAFEIYQAGYPANEFTGLPVAEELMRQFDEQFQLTLNGDQSVDDMLASVQEQWSSEF
ncbi:MAG: carbohydrate-binding protein [Glaciihabitans sp.]|nr:carbohydrate-binding protein [Glaciihabitans sp.]